LSRRIFAFKHLMLLRQKLDEIDNLSLQVLGELIKTELERIYRMDRTILSPPDAGSKPRLPAVDSESGVMLLSGPPQ